MPSKRIIETDFLVLGSGIAGLWFSHRVARAGKVLIVTKKSDTDSNTNYAQGGIAAAFGIDDSPDLHCQDTIRAGEGLCRDEVVRIVAREGPGLVRQLNEVGVGFDTYTDRHGDQHFQLGREGGHLRSRIVHARDYTGMEVEHGLVRAVRENRNVTVCEDSFAVDLVQNSKGAVTGCVMITDPGAELVVVRAGKTLLATGGVGQVYEMTTNPPIATGDGIAMAFRAGARIANMEFIQFHPTALYGHRIDGRAFLITEAARGEGGQLKTREGYTFMERYHELGNLAPRDVVARAIDAELKKRGDDYVLLDMTHLDPDRVRDRFPNIHQQCLKFGIDITIEPIPVVPAAHYVCGGIETNSDAETSLPGLFAAGECACSGLHGANRLASNSLLEALVLSDRAARLAIESAPGNVIAEPVAQVESSPGAAIADSEIAELAARLRSTMSHCAAIVRTDQGLAQAADTLHVLTREVDVLAGRASFDTRVQELRNMTLIGRLIVLCARARRESRGLHYNIDCPGRDDVHFRRDTVVRQEDVL